MFCWSPGMLVPGLPRVLPSLPQTPSGAKVSTPTYCLCVLKGLTILEKSGNNRRYHGAPPRYCRSSLTVEVGSSSTMAPTFSGSVPFPSLVTQCPRYSSSILWNWHFSGISLRFASLRRRNTYLRFFLCSSFVLPGKWMREGTFWDQ